MELKSLHGARLIRQILTFQFGGQPYLPIPSPVIPEFNNPGMRLIILQSAALMLQ